MIVNIMPDIILDISPVTNRLTAVRNKFTELSDRLTALEGGTSLPPSNPDNRNKIGINTGSIADYENRLFRNVAKQAREFTPIGATGISFTVDTLSPTSSRVNFTDLPIGLYSFGYRAGGADTISTSHGTFSAVKRSDITDWTHGKLTITSVQSTLTFTITNVDSAVGFNDFSINRISRTDANGYPLEDSDTILWDAYDKAGTYAISYTGAAIVTSALTGVVSDLVYDSGTNKSTAKFTLDGSIGDRDISILRFTNVQSGGLNDLKIMAPVDIGSVTSYDPDDTKFFDDKTLEKLALFDGLRLMVTCAANSNQDVTIADRNKPEQYTYSINPPGYGFEGKGMPWECVGALCNEIKAKNPNFERVWVCVPVLYDDTAIADMFLAIKNGKPSIGLPALASGIKVEIEYGNELWNDAFGFQHSIWNMKLGELEKSPGTDADYDFDGNGTYKTLAMRRLAKRTLDIIDILEDTIPGAFGTTHLAVIGTQQANVNNTLLIVMEYLDLILHDRFQLYKNNIMFGGSAYYNPNATDTTLTADNLWASGSMDVENWRQSLKADSDIIAAYAPPTGVLPWDSYEGGTSFETPYPGQDGLSEADANRLRGIIEDANHDARVTAAIVDHHNIRSAYGGQWVFYLTIGGQHKNSPWDFLDSFYIAENTPKMQGIINLKNSDRVLPNRPLRTAPFSTNGNNWDFRSEGYGQGNETGGATIAPQSNYGYTFRVNEPGNYRLIVDANSNTIKAALGSLSLGTFSGSSPFSVNLPDNLAIGNYGIRLRNVGTSQINVNTITVQAR